MSTEGEQEQLIPLADPGTEFRQHRDAILSAVAQVLDSGFFILGPQVKAFEKSLATSLGVSDAIGVGSGTDALALALLALNVGPGDEVITVSHTAGPTVAAIRITGATPVFVDIAPDTYCMDPATVGTALSPRTKAIIAVHLYGHPADVSAIRAAAPGIAVVEDCAQAQGATWEGRPVGSLGTIACFSFYPTKNLGAMGDGGAVATSDAALADRVRQLRIYGWTKAQFSELRNGRCSRLDEVQAAILSIKLRTLPETLDRRRAVAARYRHALADLPIVLPCERPGAKHAYHLFVLRSDRRDGLEQHLAARGIGTGRHYPYPVHRQPGLAAHARHGGSLAVTENFASEILSLPIFTTLSGTQIERVIAAVRDFFR